MRKYFLLGIYFLILSLLFVHPINTGDFFHHLNTGVHIVKHHSLPYHDDLSFTAYGKPWIAYAWGSGLIFYAIYQTVGPIGITILFAFLGILTSILLYLLLRKLKIINVVVLVLTTLSTVTLSLRWPSRPEILGPLFIIALLYLLVQKKRLSWWTPLFFLLWSLLYGSSCFLGILILGLYIAVNRKFDQKTLLYFVLNIIASFANGYGTRSFFYFTQIPDIATHVAEWQSMIGILKAPDLAATYKHFVYAYLVFAFIFFIIFIFGVLKNRKVLWQNLFFTLLGFAVILPFINFRFINLAPLLVAPLLGLIINSTNKNVRLFLLALCALGTIGIGIISFASAPFNMGLDRSQFEPKVIEYLKKNAVNGNIFTLTEVGSYLSYNLPESKVFVDTRDDLYEQTDVYKDIGRLANREVTINALLSKYKADIVVDDLRNGIHYQTLFYHPLWHLVYIYDDFFVFVSDEIFQKNGLKEYEAIDLLRQPATKIGLLDQARSDFEDLLSQDPESKNNAARLKEIKSSLDSHDATIKR